jgi:hypothetical protein
MQSNENAIAAQPKGNALRQKLDALALDDDKRTKTARLWDVYAEIEKALSAGVSQKSVIEVLKAHGLSYTPGTFRTTLQRLRNRARKGQAKTKQKPSTQTTTAYQQHRESIVEPPEPETNQQNGLTDPREIDRISRTTPDLDKLAAIGRRKK